MSYDQDEVATDQHLLAVTLVCMSYDQDEVATDQYLLAVTWPTKRK